MREKRAVLDCRGSRWLPAFGSQGRAGKVPLQREQRVQAIGWTGRILGNELYVSHVCHGHDAVDGRWEFVERAKRLRARCFANEAAALGCEECRGDEGADGESFPGGNICRFKAMFADRPRPLLRAILYR